MNKEQAKQLWPIIKAFSEGKQIQHLEKTKHKGNQWYDLPLEIDFTRYWISEEICPYRIKPEPREYWLFNGIVHQCPESAICEKERSGLPYPIINVREVCPT